MPEIMFLTLSSSQPNCSKRDNEISWALHNFDLGCHKWVGISSLSIEFKNEQKNFGSNVNLCLNLIDTNSYNESGIILTIPGENAYAVNKNVIEFWKLDTRRPKNVTFTFRNSNVNIMENFKVTLAFAKTQNAPQTVVRFKIF